MPSTRDSSAISQRFRIHMPVWLLSTGLAVGIVLILLMLGVIVANGVVVFWPREAVVFTLKEDSAALGPAGHKRFAAYILDKHDDSHAVGHTPIEEYYLYVGSREILGDKFHYLPMDAVARKERPKDVVVAERVSHGDALIQPVAIVQPDGSEILTGDANFHSKLRAALDDNASLRKAITELEQKELAQLNREIEMLRRETKQAGSPALSARNAELQETHERVAAQLRGMRTQLENTRLRYTLYSGELHEESFGNILNIHHPNAMNMTEKLGFFVTHFWAFLTTYPREANTEGGIFPIIVGTCILTLLMSILVMPLGVIAAVYLREYAKPGPVVNAVRISVSNLAGVPSIVYGVFGLGFFVYFLGGSIDQLFFSDQLPAPTFGTGGILWAALTLAMLTLPVVIVATEESLASFPSGMREASLACGASKWQTLWRVVLPASVPGMLTGLILSVARAAGEVAPLMLVGVVAFAPDLPVDEIAPWFHFDRKFMHLGYHIYALGFLTPDSEAAMPMVFATTLLLILLVVVLNVGAIVMRDYMRRRYTTDTF